MSTQPDMQTEAQASSQSGAGASPRGRADLVTGLVIMALAAFFFNETFAIPFDPEEGDISPRFFPQSICLMLGLLGGILAFQGGRGITAPDDNCSFDMQDFLFKVLPLSVLSFVYVWLFQGFGYILATIVTLAIACYLFGVRGLRLLILPPVVSVIFYYLFFGLMGVFEPPAEIFDLLAIFRS
ncbi:tripartite tricarboxylate transporter TctB family protein [Aliamphritea spongicola]|uniref:tripartite tricarboxylate transporter TctB family protein n=1 Tax=Aliamphritea spongicola TaxID=707589 RepID=UPI00196B423A|nr:tripartite tricarboxylate transporter TctB family protein [Aliamphritea spongicola]MBN3560823.1 tripartite tricarboxylate transporter TctB family protein [Aliamphritea spongicola]